MPFEVAEHERFGPETLLVEFLHSGTRPPVSFFRVCVSGFAMFRVILKTMEYPREFTLRDSFSFKNSLNFMKDQIGIFIVWC